MFVRAVIALQEPARLLQHLFYFIAHETISSVMQTKATHSLHWQK